MTEGHPTERKDDLRYYLDSSGRFTTTLRQHYDPARRDPNMRRAYVKCGTSWLDVPFNLLSRGMVFRLLDTDGKFVTWADDGSPDLLALDDPSRNDLGVWGVRTRKPTEMEFSHA
jgi:hypothetical protein